MKFGKLPPPPEDDDFSNWCPFDALESGDYFTLLDYIGGCPNCVDGTLKVPNEFLVKYIRDSADGTYHVFRTIEIVRCSGCGSMLDYVSVLCQSKNTGIDVSKEFNKISK